eukprot:CAMPEP_0116050378 /NCGR_PEP_ID=MMETSP0322-20121206/345_1 /TAXON_ID=163516 /ORGANISM="Leptocylindrus danicus var. apora, Strain B651" /LENGTH=776 /DNA_ID=CAMNT_0003532917 /DNA_START=175 /DNA_END=2504 /DNA_ORIENTATION=+
MTAAFTGIPWNIKILQNNVYTKRSRDKSLLSSTVKKSSATSTDAGYSADQITVLSGLEPVRKRPGMYIGSTGPAGLHHLVWEVVDNSVDEALAGHATYIHVCINENNSITVTDNGRGIPCGIHPKTGVSALETVLTVLHAGGKFENDSSSSGYKVSGGLHGVGISVVNALSESVDVDVLRDGKLHSMGFERGIPTSGLIIEDVSDAINNNNPVLGRFVEPDALLDPKKKKKSKGIANVSGTSVTFLPDINVFKEENGKASINFTAKRLEGRMDEMAYLNAGLALTLTDLRSKGSSKKKKAESDHIPSTKEFFHAGGLAEYVSFLTKNKTPLFGAGSKTKSGKEKGRKRKRSSTDPLANLLTEDDRVIYVSGEAESSTGNGAVSISVSLTYSSDMFDETILSFCNNIRTKDGGSHVDGLKAALTRTVNQMNKKSSKGKEGPANIPGEFIREGLTVVVAVNVADPEFEGQTKGRLGSPYVRPCVDALVCKELTKCFEWSPDILNAIVEKATAAQSASAAARAARDLVRRKSLLTSTVLPGKLADCASRDPEESEIFIVEGDSAAGSAKQGRDRSTQAILPLRGKILNIERAAAEKIYQNNELQSLISALGLGIKGSELDMSNLRYHRIVVMTDADVDGAAYSCAFAYILLYRYQRELIEKGYVYIACPPLYKITTSKILNGKKEHYVFNEDEKMVLLEQVGNEVKTSIQRFKGLGEMMPEQLWTTTMDPKRRKMLKVTIEDCAAADSMLSILMGDAVAPRREFISTNAENFQLDDLDV